MTLRDGGAGFSECIKWGQGRSRGHVEYSG